MALATSKRKFYKLLDDLSGANKRSSTDTPSSSADRPSKRSRTLATATFRAGSRDGPGAPGRANSGRTTVRLLSSTFESRAGLSGAPPTAATTSATTATAGTGANAAAAAATPAQARLGGLPATYAPWSHEQFLDRLRTFADVKRWRPKPPAVGEVAWARRGWEVVGDDEVACSFCGRHVVLRLDGGGGGGGGEHEGDGGGNASEDKWWTVEAEEKLVAKYEALVVSGHSEECLWRAAGCKDDIYRIKFGDQSHVKAELVQRYQTLSVFGSALPAQVNFPSSISSKKPSPSTHDLVEWFTEVLHDGGSGNTTAVSDEAQEPNNDGDAANKANISALLLALCGWSGEKIADVPIATCQKCFTRLGLWMYQPKPDAPEDTMTLDPVSLHRSYCPWQDPVSMSALGSLEGMAGWQVLADAVAGQIERAKRQKRKTSYATEDDVDSIVTSRASKEELDSEDRARESKLARLKRAFAVKKGKKA